MAVEGGPWLTRTIAGLAASMAVVLAACGGGSSVDTETADDEAVDEVGPQTGVADDGDFEIDLEECVVNEFGAATASGTITNTSDLRQGFSIDVLFTNPDGTLIDQSPTGTDEIDPGESGTWTAIAFEDPQSDAVSCELEVS